MSMTRELLRTMLHPPHRSIGTKLFLVFVIFVCLSVGAVGIPASLIAKSTIVSQMGNSSEQLIVLAGEKLDMKLQSYSDLSNQLIHNSSFTNHLFQVVSPNLSKEEFDRRTGEMQGMLEQLALSDPHIYDISLLPLEDQMASIGTRGGGEEQAPILDEATIEKIRNGSGTSIWLPVKEHGYNGKSVSPLFAYGKLLGKSNIGSHDFILLVQLESSLLHDMTVDVKLSPGANTALYDNSNQGMLGGSDTNSAVEFQRMNIAGNELEKGYFVRENQQEEQLLTAFRKSPVNGWTLIGVAPVSELNGSAVRIEQLTIWTIVASAIAAILIGIWLIRSIGLPLRRLQELMVQAANGNLKGRLQLHGKDEIGRVAEAYNRMMEQIESLVIETRQTVQELTASGLRMKVAATGTASSSDHLFTASKEIAAGAFNLSDNATISQDRVLQMGQRLEHTLFLQDRMSSSALEVNGSCGEGSNRVEALIHQTSETEQYIQHVNERMDGLRVSTESIEAVLALMTNLVKKTKILSLNASIEAANAGEAGIGFKAVAREIGNLAEESGASIIQVGQITQEVRHEMLSAVSSISGALPFFKQMKNEVYLVHQLFAHIQQHMIQLVERSEDVSQSLRQLEETHGMLFTSIGEVLVVSDLSTSVSNRVASLCESQRAIGTDLVGLSILMKEASEKLETQLVGYR